MPAAIWLTVLAAFTAAAAPAGASVPAWTTYRHDGARTGIDPDASAPVTPTQLWETTPALDGQIYGEPLVYGSRVYVATENDSVYALDAASGKVLWRASAGTPVPSGELACGDIAPTVGITSTPVIDPRTNQIYAVAANWDGARVSRRLVGFDLITGAAGAARVVDPPLVAPDLTKDLLQRGSLALDGTEIVIPYGGNDGDCGHYHGWLVGAQENGSGALVSYEAAASPGDSRGAIWGAGSAPAIDASGNLYVATGNGDPAVPGDQESVVKLGPGLNVLDRWRPSNWAGLDATDKDLGSSEPLLLPGGYLFQTGKDSNGYLLHAGALGGNSGPVATLNLCGGAEAKGGAVYGTGLIYLSCDNGIRAVAFNQAAGTISLVTPWTVTGNANGPPILAGGLVWSAGYNNGKLYGLDLHTGVVVHSFALGSFNHFSSPGAAGGRLFAADGNKVTALQIASPPAPSPTGIAITSSANPVRIGAAVTFTATVSPVPDGGTVHFAASGAPAACAAVALNPLTGQASCATAFTASARVAVSAAYSGDSYFAPSASAPMLETVSPAPSRGRAPVLSRVHLNRSVFTGRGGTTLTLTLSAPAGLTAVVYRVLPGRRSGRRCSSRVRRGDRCTLSLRKLRLTFSARRGLTRHRVRLPGLAPGSYLIVVTATDASGKSQATSLRFRLRRR